METIDSIMVITLGIGRGIEHGIFTSILENRPKEIIYLASLTSMNTAERVKEVFAAHPQYHQPPEEVVTLTDETSLKDVYEKTLSAFKMAKNKGYAWEQIILDFTCGTKVMSAGAVLAAFLHGCKRLVYVGGSQKDDAGKTVDGSEEIVQPAGDLLDTYQEQFKQQLLDKGFSPQQVETILEVFQREQIFSLRRVIQTVS